jgi:hypothetical protein
MGAAMMQEFREYRARLDDEQREVKREGEPE